MILENKTDAIVNALVEQGLVHNSNRLRSAILDALRNGGSFQLLENGHDIVAKSVVRNKSGKVIGMQG